MYSVTSVKDPTLRVFQNIIPYPMSNLCWKTLHLFHFFIKKALRSLLLTPSLDAEQSSIKEF